VVIVHGSAGPPEDEPPAARARAPARRAAGTPPPRDPVIVALEREETGALVERLEAALEADPRGETRPRWTDLASVLLLRGSLAPDDEALAGLFSIAARMGPGRTREEFATFVADAFVQAPMQTLGTLGAMDRATRGAVATLLAETTVALFPGQTGDPQLPWPTRRVPREALGAYGRRAWDALATVEAELRPAPGLASGGR
jgi:hypothetical protein